MGACETSYLDPLVVEKEDQTKGFFPMAIVRHTRHCRYPAIIIAVVVVGDNDLVAVVCDIYSLSDNMAFPARTTHKLLHGSIRLDSQYHLI